MTLVAELAVGVTLGLLARLYFFALETLATSVAMTFGLGNIFGTPISESEPAPPLSSFIVFCAVTLIFVTDLHLDIIRALYLSYETTPVLATPEAKAFLSEMARVLTQSHLLALRICSPFLVFGLVVNVAIGLLARLTPQVQIYFISGPLLIFLGIYALMLLSQDFFTAFTAEFGDWARRG
jgi:flagellar biosynthetic protein FliR